MDVFHAAPFIFFLIFLLSVVIGARRQGNTRATDEESRRPMPGDSLMPRPDYSRTRAVTIKAPPSVIWEWVERAGHGDFNFAKAAYIRDPVGGKVYGRTPFTISENETEYMGGPGLKPGDKVTLHQSMDVYVNEVEPRRLLVMFGATDKATGHAMPFGGPMPEKYFAMSLALFIEEKQDGFSRLILRSRNTYGRNVAVNAVTRMLAVPAYTMAEKAILLGIKKKAEEAEEAAAKK
jgi:hypothetical protein